MQTPTSPMLDPVSEVLRLPHRANVVASARHRVRASLAAGGITGQVLDDAEMVVSELLGNAIRYAAAIADGAVVLAWRVRDELIELRVTDGGSGRVVEARAASATAVCGRGLHIVERLAASWGVTDHTDGMRTVWAVLPVGVALQALTLAR
jgi:anti-sigma regulatory factor (Ser/Thr protein kinase)